MKIFRPHSRPNEQKPLGMELRNLCLISLPGVFDAQQSLGTTVPEQSHENMGFI